MDKKLSRTTTTQGNFVCPNTTLSFLKWSSCYVSSFTYFIFSFTVMNEKFKLWFSALIIAIYFRFSYFLVVVTVFFPWLFHYRISFQNCCDYAFLEPIEDLLETVLFLPSQGRSKICVHNIFLRPHLSDYIGFVVVVIIAVYISRQYSKTHEHSSILNKMLLIVTFLIKLEILYEIAVIARIHVLISNKGTKQKRWGNNSLSSNFFYHFLVS